MGTTVETVRKNAPFVAVMVAILLTALALSIATVSLIMRL
jgi:hypothetical protein